MMNFKKLIHLFRAYLLKQLILGLFISYSSYVYGQYDEDYIKIDEAEFSNIRSSDYKSDEMTLGAEYLSRIHKEEDLYNGLYRSKHRINDESVQGFTGNIVIGDVGFNKNRVSKFFQEQIKGSSQKPIMYDQEDNSIHDQRSNAGEAYIGKDGAVPYTPGTGDDNPGTRDDKISLPPDPDIPIDNLFAKAMLCLTIILIGFHKLKK